MGIRKVLVIGIDGLRWDRVADAAPRLRHLAATGVLAIGAHPRDSPARTESGPGWATLATGVGPAKHGVRRNSFAGSRFARYPDFLTLAARARPGLSTFVAVDWPPLVGSGLFGPEIGTRICGDGETYGYATEDVRIADAAADLLGRHQPDAAFVYFGAVDSAGHRHGPLTQAYLDAIAHVDALVGRLIDAVRARPEHAAEDWLIMVGTDHGHRDRGGHGRRSAAERATFVLANGAAITSDPAGDVADIAVTALDHLGVPLDPDHGFDGRSLIHSG